MKLVNIGQLWVTQNTFTSVLFQNLFLKFSYDSIRLLKKYFDWKNTDIFPLKMFLDPKFVKNVVRLHHTPLELMGLRVWPDMMTSLIVRNINRVTQFIFISGTPQTQLITSLKIVPTPFKKFLPHPTPPYSSLDRF